MPTDNDSDLALEPMPEQAPRRTRQPALPLSKPALEFGRPPDATRRRGIHGKASPAAPVDEDRVGDYRHPDAHRTNIPEAGVATQDRSVAEKVAYAYPDRETPSLDPHLDPQLVWAGKAEHTSFDVDTVSLHIHERVSTAAVLRAVRREEVQRTLFSDPQFSIDQELAFYHKSCQPTIRSHLSQAVCDSGWEARVARALDESPRVRAWVKNHRLGFEIPYLFRREEHAYTPDFLVELVVGGSPTAGEGCAAIGEAAGAAGEHLVIEVKGLEREQDRAKQVGMQRWISAVNHWGRLGRWRFEKLHSPHDLGRVL